MSSEKRKYELRARAEQQRETRERIVTATMELHRDIGPAATTVAEIARRAGVQRLTVYNHFPEEIELFGACQAQWMGLNPFPDVTDALAQPDPVVRARSLLAAVYRWYRATAPMTEHVQRDRGSVPALDSLLAQSADAMLGGLADALAGGFKARGRRAQRVRALAALALDFWTWRRLDHEGLDDATAASLVASMLTAAATPG